MRPKQNKNSIKKKGKSKKGRPRIPWQTQLKLWVHAGGRCEFSGCNEYLFRDDLTLSETNYANIAHIVSWKKTGLRGDDPLPLDERNDLPNLILMCQKHHTLIDSKEHIKDFPKALLHSYKRSHEDRIERLTASHPECKTTIIRFKANVGDEVVDIPDAQIRKAISPFYPIDPQGIEIDLTKFGGLDSPAYWESAKTGITRQLQKLYAPGIETGETQHVSVFALGPIPLLVHLGHGLSNKITTHLYQRHRNTEDWIWKKDGTSVGYTVNELRSGSQEDQIVLILSLSGSISIDDLPSSIKNKSSVYEITLDGMTPNPMCLSTTTSLESFKSIYQEFLRSLKRSHPKLKEIHLFPAVPAPIAVECGRQLIHKVDPTIRVYDFNKNKGGFKFTLNVN